MNQTDSTTRTKITAENLTEGIAIVDSEALIGAGGETTGVLVEREMEDGGGGIWGWIRGRWNWG
jgi:hypothetical protein